MQFTLYLQLAYAAQPTLPRIRDEITFHFQLGTGYPNCCSWFSSLPPRRMSGQYSQTRHNFFPSLYPVSSLKIKILFRTPLDAIQIHNVEQHSKVTK
jgi:hypothetical protein